MSAEPDAQSMATNNATAGQRSEASWMHKLALHLCAGAIRMLMYPIARMEIPDLTVRPQAGKGLIIAANHRSMLDIFVGLITFSRWHLYPHMLVRGDICRLPVIGRLLRELGGIPAGRGHSCISDVKSLLNNGRALAFTPEGRIVPPEERVDGLGELKPGIGHLAGAHGTPILLVAMTNTDSCWPLGKRLPRFRLFTLSKRPVIRIVTQMMTVEAGADTRQTVQAVRYGLSGLLADGSRA